MSPTRGHDDAGDVLAADRLTRALETLSAAVGEHAVALARVEVKLDNALVRADDHEARLRRVERRVWTFSALSAGATAALETAVTRLLMH